MLRIASLSAFIFAERLRSMPPLLGLRLATSSASSCGRRFSRHQLAVSDGVTKYTYSESPGEYDI
eukprot:scaffold1724_cov246-Pinguiococcus_pyrenoidosus.AAC.12